MGVISDQWTGNGLADGTALSAGNVATAGNFTGTAVTWVHSPAGSPTQQTAGDGFVVATAVSTDIARLDGLTTGNTSMRIQCLFSAPASAAGIPEIIRLRTASTSLAFVRYDGSTRVLTVRDANNNVDLMTSAAITADDKITIDLVATLHASPTTSNGRIFCRLINNTNVGWNSGAGYQFYDSLYTRNIGVANWDRVYFGKANAVGTAGSPGWQWEFCGLEPIAVNPADTSESDASAYFADNPSAPYALETGSVTALVAGYRLG